MTPLAHIASVVAIWSMMLFGLRFAAAAGGWIMPLIRVVVCRYCRGMSDRQWRRALVRTIDRLHLDLNRAITTPWSATLLFTGSLLIGLGYACGSSGDAAQLVSDSPEGWVVFDVVTDCIAAVLGVTGMAFVHAATAHRRTASFLVSAVLIGTGVGIGALTL